MIGRWRTQEIAEFHINIGSYLLQKGASPALQIGSSTLCNIYRSCKTSMARVCCKQLCNSWDNFEQTDMLTGGREGKHNRLLLCFGFEVCEFRYICKTNNQHTISIGTAHHHCRLHNFCSTATPIDVHSACELQGMLPRLQPNSELYVLLTLHHQLK